MPVGPQSPPTAPQDLRATSYTTPNITFAGKDAIFALSGSSGGAGVTELNGVSGFVDIVSSDNSITISETGQDINLLVNFPTPPPFPQHVTTLNGLDGVVDIKSAGSIAITQTGQDINLEIDPDYVVSNIKAGINTYEGQVEFISNGGTILFSDSGGKLNLESVAIAGVDTINSITGTVNLTSPNNSVAISVNGQDIELETVSGGPANILSGTDIFITADEGITSVSPADVLIVAKNGDGGNISLQSQAGGVSQKGGLITLESQGGSGVGGLYGRVSLTAQPGTDALTSITTGGLIDITANTGLAVGALCSVIRMNSASIQSYAGAIGAPYTVTPGFQTIYGNQGISLTAGSPAVLPQVPFTIYQYATGGISLDSTVYTNQMRPYWDGLGAVPDLTISGRSLPSQAYVVLEDVKSIAMGSTGSITGVNTINGSAYPPSSTPVFVDAYQIYVAPNGSDTTGSGSQQNPFQTIAKAITQRATISNTVEVSIILSSGTYTESPTLTRNTYIVGVPTGESRQPSNVIGTITMNDTTGSIGISSLELNGNVSITGSGASCTIVQCNISVTSATTAVSASGGNTVFITECRMTGAGATVVNTSATTTIRDTSITVTSANICVNSSTTLTIRQCNMLNTSTSIANLPIIRLAGSVNFPVEITYTKCVYSSAVVDTGTNKCAVQFTNTANTITAQIAHCIFDCPGAVTGTPSIQCIQDIGAGGVSLTSGNIQCVGSANFVAPNVTSTPMFPVLQSRYASFSSDQIQTMVTANTPQIITHNTTEINTGGFALSSGSIQVLKAGNYEVGISIQFIRVVGASVTNVNFWFRVNGVDVPRSCSQISITGNDAEFLATVSIIPSLNANDVIQVMFGGPDTAVEVYAEPAETTPLAKPAIPSIITNIKLLL